MKPTRRMRIVAGALVGLAGLAGALAVQRREMGDLRRELARHSEGRMQVEVARAENERLKGQQVSAEELARLRADHAALPRLRREIEELKARIEGRGR